MSAVRDAVDALERAKELDEYVNSRDQLDHSQERMAGLQARLCSAEIVNRAQRRIGQLLNSAPKGKPGRPKKNGGEPRQLSRRSAERDSGIHHRDAEHYQELATLDDDDYESRVARLKLDGKRPTIDRVLERDRHQDKLVRAIRSANTSAQNALAEVDAWLEAAQSAGKLGQERDDMIAVLDELNATVAELRRKIAARTKGLTVVDG